MVSPESFLFLASCTVVFLIFPIYTTFQSVILNIPFGSLFRDSPPKAVNTPLVVFTFMMFSDIYAIKNNVEKGQGCRNGRKRE